MQASTQITMPVAVQVSPNVKPGYLTTEFWSTQLVHLLTLVSMVLTLTGHTFHDTALTPLVPAAAIVASGLAQGWYSWSRGKLKAQIAETASKSINAGPDPLKPMLAILDALTKLAETRPATSAAATPVEPAAAPVEVVPPATPPTG